MVVGKVVGFVNIFLILTHLTVYQYGLTELVFSVVSTIGLFLLPGLAATVTADLGVERAGAEYGKMKALFLEFFTMSMILSIAAWALLFFGSTLVAELSGNVLIDKFFKIISFSFLVSPFRVATTMLATVMVRYADQSFFGVSEEIAKCLLLVVFFYWFERGADGLLWATVLAPVFAVLFFLPRTLSAYKLFGAAQPDKIEPLWNALREHRKWSVASTYVNTISKNLRLWIIKLMLGTEAVGLYSFALGIFSQFGSIANLQSALTPVVPLYIGRPALLARIMAASIKYQLVLSLIAGTLGALATPILIYLFFPNYVSTLTLSLVVLLAILPNGITGNLTPVFTAFKEQRTLFFSIVLRVLSMVIFLPLCIFLWGMTGAGIEFVLTAFITSFERFMRVKRFLPGFALTPGVLYVTDAGEKQLIMSILRRSGVFAIYEFMFRRAS